MSKSVALNLTLSSEESSGSLSSWVRLEQIVPNNTKRYTSVSEVYRLWNLAASGVSARTERPVGCPVEFDGSIVRFFLGFYTWPSDPNLPYSLFQQPALGKIGPVQGVELQREFSAFINNFDVYDLPYYMEDVVVTWESPVYNKYGESITPPTVTNHHTHLSFSAECFGALRISGKAVGNYYVLTVEIDKPIWDDDSIEEPSQLQGDITYVNTLPVNRQNANVVTGIDITITAIWETSENTVDTDQLRLEIPQCVLDVLAFCPGQSAYILNWCEEKTDTIVYYSACSGEVVKVCTGLNPHKYCSQFAMNDDPGPWLKNIIDQ